MAPPMVLDIVLLHYPVLNKQNKVIGSAVTNLDIHDIARVARTFGVRRYYIATPYEDQRRFIGDIVAHWRTSVGKNTNSSRGEALGRVCVVEDLEHAVADATARHGKTPFVVATSATSQSNEISYTALLSRLAGKAEPMLVVFGTAYGLAPDVIFSADGSLPPIAGIDGYNHLSVRSAVSIILDRLLGSGNSA